MSACKIQDGIVASLIERQYPGFVADSDLRKNHAGYAELQVVDVQLACRPGASGCSRVATTGMGAVTGFWVVPVWTISTW